MTTVEFRKLMKWVRKQCPIDTPVNVRRYPCKKRCAITRFDGSRFFIRIKSDQDRQGQIDALLHEWAHAGAINNSYKHEGEWPVIYGAIYTAWDRTEWKDIQK